MSTTSWHIRLFNKSVLKQAKFRQLCKAAQFSSQNVIDSDKRLLDLGSDNGVISHLLRELGGNWASADLTQDSVDSIRSLVVSDVHLLDPYNFPFEDEEFDMVLVVDMLEHVEDDARYVKELRRVLKSGGRLIINVPNLKKYSPLKFLRNLIGQTDESHGHLRPGYSSFGLRTLLGESFAQKSQRTYSRFFSEAIDTAIVFAYSLLSGKKGYGGEEGEVSKGLVVTESEMKKFEKKFKLFSLIYPLVYAVSRLDYIICFVPGFMRIAVFEKN